MRFAKHNTMRSKFLKKVRKKTLKQRQWNNMSETTYTESDGGGTVRGITKSDGFEKMKKIKA